MVPIKDLTLKQVEKLRQLPPGTNGKSISTDLTEIIDMQKHLKTLYVGRVTLPFSEKICNRNKAYEI